MKWFGSRLAVVSAGAFVSMVVAGARDSSAACDPNMSYNWATNNVNRRRRCRRGTRPRRICAVICRAGCAAPSAVAMVVTVAPMWSTGFHQWGAYFTGVWVPY